MVEHAKSACSCDFCFFVERHCYFPAHFDDSTFGGLLDKGGHNCLAPPPPVRALVFISHRVHHFHCPSIFIDFFATHALVLSAATLQSGKRHPLRHLQKLPRNRKVVFFQSVDVIAVEASAWTAGHDKFPHTVLPAACKRHPGRRSENTAVRYRPLLQRQHTPSRLQRLRTECWQPARLSSGWFSKSHEVQFLPCKKTYRHARQNASAYLHASITFKVPR